MQELPKETYRGLLGGPTKDKQLTIRPYKQIQTSQVEKKKKCEKRYKETHLKNVCIKNREFFRALYRGSTSVPNVAPFDLWKQMTRSTDTV